MLPKRQVVVRRVLVKMQHWRKLRQKNKENSWKLTQNPACAFAAKQDEQLLCYALYCNIFQPVFFFQNGARRLLFNGKVEL